MGLWPLAAFSLLATRWAAGIPAWAMTALVVAAAGVGLWCARRVLRQPPAALELLPEGRARWQRDGIEPLKGPAIAHEQWPVTTVRFLGCRTTVAFWPDTLCASGRRHLRRWARSVATASPLPQFWMG